MDNTDPNRHVKEFLSYYVNYPGKLKYAVMVNGPWGIGKTHLVRELLDEVFKSMPDERDKCVYVSLYGIESCDEIDEAILSAIYPLIDNRYAQAAGRIALAAGKTFGFDAKIDVRKFLSNERIKYFVFDDLERCEMQINRILGFINQFVEHQGKKVVIIGHETELEKKAIERPYKEIREKLIGKTLEVQSVFDQALQAFFKLIEDEGARNFLAKKETEISEIYRQSGLQNLRILRQTMWDFERVFQTLSEKHRSNDIAMTFLLRFLFSLSLEVKAGRLQTVDLTNRYLSIIPSGMEFRSEETPRYPLREAQERYPKVKFYDNTLSDSTLINLLIKGLIEEKTIHAELDASDFFMRAADLPAWRIVWNYHDFTQDEFREALVKMEQQFANRAFAHPGDILHVLGLRLFLSKIGELDHTTKDIFEEGKRYIDDLYSSGQIDPPSYREDPQAFYTFGYGGLGIHETETAEFQSLFKQLEDKRRQVEIDRRPAIAKGLLQDMESDPDRFFNRVSTFKGSEDEFYSIPIMASIEAREFVAVLSKQHPTMQKLVLTALSNRYKHGSLGRALTAEKAWAKEMRTIMLTESEAKPPIERHRVRQLFVSMLDVHLGINDGNDDVSAGA